MTYESILQSRREQLTKGAVSRDSIAVERIPEAMDEIQHMASRELVIASLNRHWNTVRQIDAALERIRDGSFGECAECGEAISQRRLQAIPWAVLCLQCQQAEDSRQSTGAFVARAA